MSRFPRPGGARRPPGPLQRLVIRPPRRLLFYLDHLTEHAVVSEETNRDALPLRGKPEDLRLVLAQIDFLQTRLAEPHVRVRGLPQTAPTARALKLELP